MADHWETAPRHMMRLDIRSLLQDAAIEEVSALCLKGHAEMTLFPPFKNTCITVIEMNQLLVFFHIFSLLTYCPSPPH